MIFWNLEPFFMNVNDAPTYFLKTLMLNLIRDKQ